MWFAFVLGCVGRVDPVAGEATNPISLLNGLSAALSLILVGLVGLLLVLRIERQLALSSRDAQSASVSSTQRPWLRCTQAMLLLLKLSRH